MIDYRGSNVSKKNKLVLRLVLIRAMWSGWELGERSGAGTGLAAVVNYGSGGHKRLALS